jgi:hypothetical protein
MLIQTNLTANDVSSTYGRSSKLIPEGSILTLEIASAELTDTREDRLMVDGAQKISFEFEVESTTEANGSIVRMNLAVQATDEKKRNNAVQKLLTLDKNLANGAVFQAIQSGNQLSTGMLSNLFVTKMITAEIGIYTLPDGKQGNHVAMISPHNGTDMLMGEMFVPNSAQQQQQQADPAPTNVNPWG